MTPISLNIHNMLGAPTGINKFGKTYQVDRSIADPTEKLKKEIQKYQDFNGMFATRHFHEENKESRGFYLNTDYDIPTSDGTPVNIKAIEIKKRRRLKKKEYN